jgi:5-formyltetrahydrofolate cyclo-ligase
MGHYRVMSETSRQAGVREEKLVLRQAVASARDCMGADARAEASGAIADRIVALDAFAKAHALLATLPYRSEWDAALVVRAALAAGKLVAAPRVDRHARMLQPLCIESLDDDVEAGYRGIPEPRARCAMVPLERFDVVLVPGIAFDVHGRRLGYGGGYYDRLLPLLPRSATRIAGAFELQVVDGVPTAPHDAAVDWIVTERRTIRCAAP